MISYNWQLWNELEFHVSEETDQEDSVVSVDCALFYHQELHHFK